MQTPPRKRRRRIEEEWLRGRKHRLYIPALLCKGTRGFESPLLRLYSSSTEDIIVPGFERD